MAAYLLGWNPKSNSPWDSLTDEVSEFNSRRYIERRWSIGNSKSISKDDRVYLIRLGEEPRGILGSGLVISDPYEDKKWNDRNLKARYVDIKFDSLFNLNGLLDIKFLKRKYPSQQWSPYQTCISIKPEISSQLRKTWQLHTKGQLKIQAKYRMVDSRQEFESRLEGSEVRIFTTKYERDLSLRNAAISLHGLTCLACGFNFEKAYGELGIDYIHVHHNKPISSSGIRRTNPKKDLDVVCPNCHAMLHRIPGKVLSIVELRKIIRANKKW